MSRKNKREYLESDIGAAAYLMCRDYQLRGLETFESGKKAFRFLDHNGKASDVALVYKFFVQALTEKLKSAQS